MRVFIPLVGQFTNVGDTLHRSVLIEWFKSDSELHLYIGNAPDSFISGLYLPENVVLYRHIIPWLLTAIKSVRYSWFVYNSGEITGTKKRFLKEILLMPILIFYRVFGRQVLKVGVDIQQRGRFEDFLYKVSNFLTNYSYYRTNNSFKRFGRGEVIPDLGFFKYIPSIKNKKYIVISMRADKYKHTEFFLKAIAEFSKKEDLAIAVVTQVRMDNASSSDIYQSLKSYGCDVSLLLWLDNFSHSKQEEVVNRIYAESLIAVSDRLHVLIAAANHGCIPLCLSDYYSYKVAQHFDVIGYQNVAFNYKGKEGDFVINALEQASIRKIEISQKMTLAKERLDLIKKNLLDRN